MLSKIDLGNVQDANYSYLDDYDIMHFVNAKEDVPKEKRIKLNFVDIRSYGLRELYGFPLLDEIKGTLTVKKDENHIYSKEKLEVPEEIKEIFELSFAAKYNK